MALLAMLCLKKSIPCGLWPNGEIQPTRNKWMYRSETLVALQFRKRPSLCGARYLRREGSVESTSRESAVLQSRT